MVKHFFFITILDDKLFMLLTVCVHKLSAHDRPIRGYHGIPEHAWEKEMGRTGEARERRENMYWKGLQWVYNTFT